MEDPKGSWPTIDAMLLEIVTTQREKLLKCGRRIVPTLTPEDVLQPNDYVELENHPHFRYEEGVLEGILTIQAALFALKRDQEARVMEREGCGAS